MTSESYIKNQNEEIVEHVKWAAEKFGTSKTQIAKILNVSERTIDNRLSGNVKTPFTIAELLKLCYFWQISIIELVQPPTPSLTALIKRIEDEQRNTLSLLKTFTKGETI